MFACFSERRSEDYCGHAGDDHDAEDVEPEASLHHVSDLQTSGAEHDRVGRRGDGHHKGTGSGERGGHEEAGGIDLERIG